MTVNYTPLLGLAQPIPGTESGNWGDVVNQQVVALLDSAVAGTTPLTTDADVTLTTAQGAPSEARQLIINCTGVRTAVRAITAPAQSKIYVVINGTSGGYAVIIRGAGPTAGISVTSGRSALVAWNGTDFTEITDSALLAAATGASLVGCMPAGTGALATTVQAKLRQLISVFDFMTATQIAGIQAGTPADVSAAVQAAFDIVAGSGGSLLFPAGKYLFASQVTLDRTYVSLTTRNTHLRISGYGAEIVTTGAISALKVKGGFTPIQAVTLEGFVINHRGNTNAIAGIEIVGAPLATCRDISVIVSSSLPATYAAFDIYGTNFADDDSTSFWTTLDHCTIRPTAGADGFCAFGARLRGSANATTIQRCTFSGSNTHILLTHNTGYTTGPNATLIDGNFFEGPVASIGIHLASADILYHLTGTRITNNRFEAVGEAVRFSGTTSAIQIPTFMMGNYADTAVATYINNLSNTYYTCYDVGLVGTSGNVPVTVRNNRGMLVQNDDSTYDQLTLRTPNVGSGLALQTYNGTHYGRWAQRTSLGTSLKGVYSPYYAPIFLGVIGGISSTSTDAMNLAGSVTFNSSTTKIVTFSLAEADSSYHVMLTGNVNETFWVTGKSVSGFTVNSSNPASTATVSWFLVR